MCTRSGRVMGNAAARSLRSRRLLGFLTRHAKLLQRVDVRQAPTLAVLCLRTCFLLELCLLFIYYSVFSSSFCSVIWFYQDPEFSMRFFSLKFHQGSMLWSQRTCGWPSHAWSTWLRSCSPLQVGALMQTVSACSGPFLARWQWSGRTLARSIGHRRRNVWIDWIAIAWIFRCLSSASRIYQINMSIMSNQMVASIPW